LNIIEKSLPDLLKVVQQQFVGEVGTFMFSRVSSCITTVGQLHRSPCRDRRIADETVHYAGSATYLICFRLPIPNPNPNPITDPNPNPNPNPNPKNNQKRKRHRNEIEHRVISKSRFCTDGGGFVRGL